VSSLRRLAWALAAAVTCLVLALSGAGAARADEPADGQKRAEAALAADQPSEAIAELEALADLGHVDAALSFDRGLAYAQRVRSGAGADGDLGRAIHGFVEARELTTSDRTRAEASRAVTALRSEVAKRRSRAGEEPDIEEGVSLGRNVTRLLPESAWFFAAIGFSLALTVALFVRRRAVARGGAGRQLGVVLGLAALPACLLTTGLGLAARAERRELREGIVVASGVRPFDARHIARADAPTLPEGGRVRLFESEGGFVRFRRGNLEGFVPSSTVAPLARPSP
jgi:hypothetical protein